MSYSSRPKPSSYVIWWNHKGYPVPMPTHWKPGYTKAHMPTPVEAAQAERAKLLQSLEDIMAKLDRLADLSERLHEGKTK